MLKNIADRAENIRTIFTRAVWKAGLSGPRDTHRSAQETKPIRDGSVGIKSMAQVGSIPAWQTVQFWIAGLAPSPF